MKFTSVTFLGFRLWVPIPIYLQMSGKINADLFHPFLDVVPPSQGPNRPVWISLTNIGREGSHGNDSAYKWLDGSDYAYDPSYMSFNWNSSPLATFCVFLYRFTATGVNVMRHSSCESNRLVMCQFNCSNIGDWVIATVHDSGNCFFLWSAD